MSVMSRNASWLMAFCLCVAVSSKLPSVAADRPNVLFIAVDDMRCDLGCYGFEFVKSPNIDRLARSGVMFQRTYCQQAVCNASRASLMTGLRPDTTRVWDLVTDFRRNLPEAVTIPQHFRKHGYRAEAFGKIFHNTFPDDVSWDVPTHRPNNVVAYSEENQRRLAEYRESMKSQGKSDEAIEKMRGPATEIQEQPDENNYDGRQTSLAIDKLRSMASDKSPFFLAVGFIRPHLPFITPKPYWDLYDRSEIPLAKNPFLPRGSPRVAFGDRSMGGFYELRGYLDYADAPSPFDETLSEEQQRELKHGYYASVSFIDAQIGRLLDTVEQLGLANNTIIVLWSDHGWKLGEHGGWCKQTNYEIDTRVPFIMRAPRATANGQSCRGLTEYVDIYPTLCELASLPIPSSLEGKSLVPMLMDSTKTVKQAAFSQFERRHEGKPYMGYAMRTDRYRYVEWFQAETGEIVARELYDHERDPMENDNLANSEVYEVEMKQLSQQLWSTLTRPSFPHPMLLPKTDATASGPSVELVWNPANDANLPPSRPTGIHRSVTFVNHGTEAIELWWISPSGDRTSYGVLDASARKSIRTRPGAVWLIESSEQKPLGYFVTQDANAVASIKP